MYLDSGFARMYSSFKLCVRVSSVGSGEGLAEKGVCLFEPFLWTGYLRSKELAEDRQNTSMGGSPREDVIRNSLVLRLGGIPGSA